MFDLNEEGRFILRTDPHCHILPGVDDGSKELAMSLAMARKAVSVGIQSAVATPHACHFCSHPKLNAQSVRQGVSTLNRLFAREGIALQLFPGMELLLNEQIPERFEAGELLSWADEGRYVLLELGFHECPAYVWKVLDYFERKQLTVMVAHPERYTWLAGQWGTFQRLVERGCFFQINVMSINALWGEDAQKLALRIMRHTPRWIVGTDSHDDQERFWGLARVRSFLKSHGVWSGPGQAHALPGTPPNASLKCSDS